MVASGIEMRFLGGGRSRLPRRFLLNGLLPRHHAQALPGAVRRITRRSSQAAAAAHVIRQEANRGFSMILRMRNGKTERNKADAYERFLIERAIPDYRSVPGNLDVSILRRDEGNISHFLTITHWASEEAIRAFAGDELLKAKYYPEDHDYLLEFEPSVQHYVVAASERSG